MRRSAAISSINLQKERVNSTPSRRDTFDAGSKPSQGVSQASAWGVSGTREMGTIGGIRTISDASVDLGSIAGQGASITIDPVRGSASAEIELGIKKGFEISGGIEIQRTPTGASVNNVSFGVNVLGFGVNAEGKGSESSKLGVSAFGLKLEVGNDKDGKTSVRLGFEIPGFETGITFQPDGEKEEKSSSGQDEKNLGFPPSDILPLLDDNKCYYVVFLWHAYIEIEFVWSPDPNIFVRDSETKDIHGQGVWLNNQDRFYAIKAEPLPYARTPAYIEFHEPPDVTLGSEWWNPQEYGKYKANFKAWASINGSLQILVPGGYKYNHFFLHPWHITNSGKYIKSYIENWRPVGQIWDMSVYEIPCSTWDVISSPLKIVPNKLLINNNKSPQNLPNQPQKYKLMTNCCDKVEEIYKYLGIAKLKKQKFKVAKQFLAPGGSGTEDCEDYYQINQALLRMLANGLIINPVSKPLGSEGKNVNATSWAAGVYEMVAEAMSNGDTTQKYEISAIMQQVQMMSALAELTRKVEFLSEALGYLPDLDTEDVPVCFTIHESHKGFGKKPLKEIDVSAAKTDSDVEKVLGKMLQPSKVPIVKWVFKPDSISIATALSKLN